MNQNKIKTALVTDYKINWHLLLTINTQLKHIHQTKDAETTNVRQRTNTKLPNKVARWDL